MVGARPVVEVSAPTARDTRPRGWSSKPPGCSTGPRAPRPSWSSTTRRSRSAAGVPRAPPRPWRNGRLSRAGRTSWSWNARATCARTPGASSQTGTWTPCSPRWTSSARPPAPSYAPSRTRPKPSAGWSGAGVVGPSGLRHVRPGARRVVRGHGRDAAGRGAAPRREPRGPPPRLPQVRRPLRGGQGGNPHAPTEPGRRRRGVAYRKLALVVHKSKVHQPRLSELRLEGVLRSSPRKLKDHPLRGRAERLWYVAP